MLLPVTCRIGGLRCFVAQIRTSEAQNLLRPKRQEGTFRLWSEICVHSAKEMFLRKKFPFLSETQQEKGRRLERLSALCAHLRELRGMCEGLSKAWQGNPIIPPNSFQSPRHTHSLHSVTLVLKCWSKRLPHTHQCRLETHKSQISKWINKKWGKPVEKKERRASLKQHVWGSPFCSPGMHWSGAGISSHC